MESNITDLWSSNEVTTVTSLPAFLPHINYHIDTIQTSLGDAHWTTHQTLPYDSNPTSAETEKLHYDSQINLRCIKLADAHRQNAQRRLNSSEATSSIFVSQLLTVDLDNFNTLSIDTVWPGSADTAPYQDDGMASSADHGIPRHVFRFRSMIRLKRKGTCDTPLPLFRIRLIGAASADMKRITTNNEWAEPFTMELIPWRTVTLPSYVAPTAISTSHRVNQGHNTPLASAPMVTSEMLFVYKWGRPQLPAHDGTVFSLPTSNPKNSTTIFYIVGVLVAVVNSVLAIGMGLLVIRIMK
jgi:hypothetical protein